MRAHSDPKPSEPPTTSISSCSGALGLNLNPAKPGKALRLHHRWLIGAGAVASEDAKSSRTPFVGGSVTGQTSHLESPGTAA